MQTRKQQNQKEKPPKIRFRGFRPKKKWVDQKKIRGRNVRNLFFGGFAFERKPTKTTTTTKATKQQQKQQQTTKTIKTAKQ